MNKKHGPGRMLPAIPACALLFALTAMTSVAASELAEDCNYCHGENGVSTDPTVPTMAGMSAYFIMDSMAIYQDRDRPCVEDEYPAGPNKGSKTDMCQIADALSEAEIEAVAQYYEDQTYVRAQQDFDSARAAAGEKLHDDGCARCHDEGGSVAEDDAGFLAGQWTPYLRQVFDHYAAGTRSMPKKMKPKIDELSPEDVEALLHYYASLQ